MVPKVGESERSVVEREEVVQGVEVVDEDAQGGIVVDELDIVDDEKGADLPLPDMAGIEVS